jgi:hypothetical protein
MSWVPLSVHIVCRLNWLQPLIGNFFVLLMLKSTIQVSILPRIILILKKKFQQKTGKYYIILILVEIVIKTR